VESTPGISVKGLTEAASGTVLAEAAVVLARRTRPALPRTLKTARGLLTASDITPKHKPHPNFVVTHPS